MLNIDLIQVAVLWCIAGLAFIGAMNVRGFFRALLSWLVAIAIAAVAIAFSYIKSVSEAQKAGYEPASVPKAVLALDSGLHFSDNANQEKDSIISGYDTVEKQLLERAISISDSILAFPKKKNINAQGIESLETFESKARALRNRSMDIYRQVRSINPAAEDKAYHELLLAAADNLRLAGYEVHRQFGQEHDSDSLNRAAIYAAQAKGAFLQLKEQL